MIPIRPQPIAAAVLAVVTGLPVSLAADNDAASVSTQAPGAVQKMLEGIRGTQRLPVLGADSESAVVRLACLAEQDADAAREALLSGHVAELPEATASCGQAQAQRALVTARLLGIRGVPYLIASDGRLHQGAPDDLEGWLEGNE